MRIFDRRGEILLLFLHLFQFFFWLLNGTLIIVLIFMQIVTSSNLLEQKVETFQRFRNCFPSPDLFCNVDVQCTVPFFLDVCAICINRYTFIS